MYDSILSLTTSHSHVSIKETGNGIKCDGTRHQDDGTDRKGKERKLRLYPVESYLFNWLTEVRIDPLAILLYTFCRFKSLRSRVDFLLRGWYHNSPVTVVVNRGIERGRDKVRPFDEETDSLISVITVMETWAEVDDANIILKTWSWWSNLYLWIEWDTMYIQYVTNSQWLDRVMSSNWLRLDSLWERTSIFTVCMTIKVAIVECRK